MRRRTALRLTAVTGVLPAAGCLGDEPGETGERTDDGNAGGEPTDEVREADLLLSSADLPGDGWEEDAPAVGGPVEFRNEALNVVVRSSVTIWRSSDDARESFERRRGRAETESDDVEELDVARRSIVYDPAGTIRAAVFFAENALGELRLFRLDAGEDAHADRIDVAELVAAKYAGWPFESGG